ncbi:helix-turn-helix domain-containing protein [Arcticibacter tournemirensis]|uniref:AraC family transcriptional regulator n=1 Tax=Arcticibacter tournemirensis TaxID=699437 RepID=A0A4Q0M5H2_9SPHI|nr:AraC family transcriptional regulator [Arcticibacter tournemirensis]RXF68194.1 AraC family transcriptional regulator [Arcticibacter tournemirensis]
MSKRILRHSFSLLHVDCARLNQKWNYKNVISPYYRLYYIDDGEGSISNEKQSIQLEPGYLYMIPSFTFCDLNCPSYLSQYFIQFFEESPDGISLFSNNRTLMKVKAINLDIENFKRLLQINPGRGINRSDNPKVYEKNIFYKEYQELNNLQSLSTYFETQGIIFQLISKFLTAATFKYNSFSKIPSKVMDAISYIQINLNKTLTVSNLAERANLHPDYFSRLFQQYTGERPVDYIHEKRIERAQYLITTSDISLDQISTETGFENLPYFYRRFKKVTGMTPGQYRDRNRSINVTYLVSRLYDTANSTNQLRLSAFITGSGFVPNGTVITVHGE